MKILIISDFHLFDTRMSPQRDQDRMEKLAGLINICGADAVLNLGDTVSRANLLRPECHSIQDGFQQYLCWRSQFSVPFIECAIERELPFFTSLTGQKPEAVFDLEPGVSVVVLAISGFEFLPEQLSFLSEALDQCRKEDRKVVIGTHMPYPGSCSRDGVENFLHVPPDLHKQLTEFPRPVWWCGGHFHWNPEPPKQTGSLTALYGARFRLDTRNDTTYLRILDTETETVDTLFPDF